METPYARNGAQCRKILGAALEKSNAEVGAFVKKDTFTLQKKRAVKKLPIVRRDIIFVGMKISWEINRFRISSLIEIFSYLILLISEKIEIVELSHFQRLLNNFFSQEGFSKI